MSSPRRGLTKAEPPTAAPTWADAAGVLADARAQLRAAVEATGRACTVARWADEQHGGDGGLAAEVDLRARSLLLALSALELLVESEARRASKEER